MLCFPSLRPPPVLTLLIHPSISTTVQLPLLPFLPPYWPLLISPIVLFSCFSVFLFIFLLFAHFIFFCLTLIHYFFKFILPYPSLSWLNLSSLSPFPKLPSCLLLAHLSIMLPLFKCRMFTMHPPSFFPSFLASLLSKQVKEKATADRKGKWGWIHPTLLVSSNSSCLFKNIFSYWFYHSISLSCFLSILPFHPSIRAPFILSSIFCNSGCSPLILSLCFLCHILWQRTLHCVFLQFLFLLPCNLASFLYLHPFIYPSYHTFLSPSSFYSSRIFPYFLYSVLLLFLPTCLLAW